RLVLTRGVETLRSFGALTIKDSPNSVSVVAKILHDPVIVENEEVQYYTVVTIDKSYAPVCREKEKDEE
ncbi:MAG: hypothetical protein RR215_06400, partial [Ruthenibacterium sp.]